MSGRIKALAAYGLLTAAAVAADQAVKRAVDSAMPLHDTVDLLPFLALFHTRNTGIAFSMLSGVGGVGLAFVSLAVIGLVLALAAMTKPGQRFARAGYALVIGGAVGNLIDRSLHGYVTDYILFHTPVWSFAVFNLADAFITVGAGLVILEELLAWLRARRAANG